MEKLIQLAGIKSAKKKQEFLKENADDEEFKSLLFYALNPLYSYGVSENSLVAPPMHPCTKEYRTIFEICEDCKGTSRTAQSLDNIRHFLLSQFPTTRSVYTQLLAKTLKLGVTAKSVNKAIPGLIPEWSVQGAVPIKSVEHPSKSIKPGESFWVTQKLNGVRATFYRGEIIGRSGLPIKGLDHIIESLKALPRYVFDGELLLKDPRGLTDAEAFQKLTGIVNSDQDKSEVCLNVFDLVPDDQFDNDNSSCYSERRGQMDALSELMQDDNVRFVPPLYHGTDQAVIKTLLNQMTSDGKEGLVINLDVPYKRRKHTGILKVKEFYTMDLPIVSYEEGTGKFKGTLGSINVDYKGNLVGVGSGFDDEQREFIWRHREELVGTLIEVKYKTKTRNKKDGKESLQFPIFCGLRTDKTDISYG